MITEVTTQYSTDIFHDPRWPLFSESESLPETKLIRQVDALELTVRITANCPDLNLATRLASRSLEELLRTLDSEEYRLWVFIAHGPWQPSNQLARLRHLWKNQPFLKMTVKKEECDIVVQQIESSVRFATLEELDTDMLSNGMQLTRTDQACFLLSSKRKNISSEVSVREIFDHAFPVDKGYPQQRANWYSLVAGLCEHGDIPIRITGAFDDNEVGVDIFGSTEQLKRMHSSK